MIKKFVTRFALALLLVMLVCAVIGREDQIVTELHRGRTEVCAGASGDWFDTKPNPVYIDWGTVTPGDDAFFGPVLLTGTFGPRVGECQLFYATGYTPLR